MQAAILNVKLRRLQGNIARKREIAKRYDGSFASLPIRTPKVRKGNTHTYHQYCIITDRRNELVNYLREEGISSAIYYPGLLTSNYPYRVPASKFPVASRLVDEIVAIPVDAWMTDSEVEQVCTSVLSFFREVI